MIATGMKFYLIYFLASLKQIKLELNDMVPYPIKDFYSPEEVTDMFQCIICTGMVVHPRTCEECEQVYCQKCIDNCKEYNNSCPSCKNSPMKMRDLGRIARSTLFNVKVKCVNCDKIVTYDKLEEHISDGCGIGYECKICNKRLNSLERSYHFENHMDNDGKDGRENIIFILSHIIRCFGNACDITNANVEIGNLLKKIYDY